MFKTKPMPKWKVWVAGILLIPVIPFLLFHIAIRAARRRNARLKLFQVRPLRHE